MLHNLLFATELDKENRGDVDVSMMLLWTVNNPWLVSGAVSPLKVRVDLIW